MALNFSWRWNRFARELFREIDPVLWHLSGRNPIDLLRRVDPARLHACARNPDFIALYGKVMAAASTERFLRPAFIVTATMGSSPLTRP